MFSVSGNGLFYSTTLKVDTILFLSRNSEVMLPNRFILFVSLVLFFLMACSKKDDTHFDPGPVLAEINGQPIHQELFEETYIRYLGQSGQPDFPGQRWRHLHTLFDHMLMAEEARKRGLADDRYELFKQKRRSRSLRNAFIDREIVRRIPEITDEESRFAFYRSKQKVHVWQLYFRNETEANLYYERIQGGEDFVDLANELYKTAEYDSLAGYIGEVSYFGIEDHYAEAAFSLQAGEISKPVRTRHGWYIIMAENWRLNHIITQTEYDSRRRKTDYQMFQRKYNVEGDKFVREYMSNLDTQPITENLERLHRVIRASVSRPEDNQLPAPQTLTEVEQNQINSRLDPMMPLVTYTEDGELKAFRVKDYLYWLDFLPYDEVIQRTVPSVGRALMWDVFARESVKRGYDADPFIEFNARHAGIFYLAGRLKEDLSNSPRPPISEDDMAAAFNMLNLGTMSRAVADFWIKEVEDFHKGREIQQRILSDPQARFEIPGIQFYERDDLIRNHPHVENYLRQTLTGQPFVAGTANAWYVFEVSDREITFYELDDRRDDIEEIFGPSYNEYLLLKHLRDAAQIRVDTLRFESLMGYYPNL